MDLLRTPDDCFLGLPGFDHEPRYADLPDGDGGTLRMAYVESGPADGPVALLLHGEPTWSASAAPTSRPGRRTTPTPGTSSGCAPWPSTSSTSAT